VELDFVEETKDRLGFKIKGRKIMESNGAYELKESPPSAYGNDFTDKVDALRGNNPDNS